MLLLNKTFFNFFLLPLFVVANAEEANVHTISNASEIIGSNATIWNTFKNNDVIDLSNLQTTDYFSRKSMPSVF